MAGIRPFVVKILRANALGFVREAGEDTGTPAVGTVF
jgi:hypothetical protein